MTLEQLLARAQERLTAALAARATQQEALVALRTQVDAGDATVTPESVEGAIASRDAADGAVTAAQREVDNLTGEVAREAELATLQARSIPTQRRAAYDQVGRVGQEERTYRPDQDREGAQFLRDVGSLITNPADFGSRERLARHMSEEQVERGEYLQRAAGTGAFAGLVVPQYLTDLYAPATAALRPFADAINKHPLPASGMTVNLSRITTATSTAIQSSENSAVSETNIDDTLLSISVQTIGGQQTLSRQAIERGTGVEGVMLEDLFRRYATTLDSTLLNQATNGLTNVATSVAYTDASPTVAEFYPKILAALAAVEAGMLDMASGDNIAVMNSRRWYWAQNALSSTWPIVAQPGIAAQMFATNSANSYGSGARGILPNGTPVIVDNNVATNLGAGTNEDEVYILDRRECHLWEDASAPMFIRAEQPAAASLGVLFVVYGYMAYTHARYAHSQKIAGTGLVTPTFTGV